MSGEPVTRTLIPHLDDVGMCHGANVAFDELTRDGFISCGSVMVPCPWFPEASALAVRRPDLDVGVHLTLTSEWREYRWRPLSTVSAASGLIDADGYFWRSRRALRRHVVVEAAEHEMRCQIDRALSAGIDVTHLDAHMGAALIPELFDVYVKLGCEYRLPVLLPRAVEECFGVLAELSAPEQEVYRDAHARAGAADPIRIDHLRTSRAALGQPAPESYRNMLERLPAGVTYIALHCTAPGDFETISPATAHHRTDEYHIFRGPDFRDWAASKGFTLSGMRALRDRLRSRANPADRVSARAG